MTMISFHDASRLTICKHLYFGRRTATRMCSEHMASIYENALKGNDYSGIVDKQKQQEEQVNKAWYSLSE